MERVAIACGMCQQRSDQTCRRMIIVYDRARISATADGPRDALCQSKSCTPWVKKQDTKLLAITPLTIIRFSHIFTSRLGSKFATYSCLNIPPHFKHVATLPCEIWMQRNGINLKYVLQLMMTDESQGSIAKNLSMSYFTTHLSFTLLVKEFLRLVNIWRSYGQNRWLCHIPHSPCTFVLKYADLVR